MASDLNPSTTTWCIDSGCTSCICNNPEEFIPDSMFPVSTSVKLGDKSTVSIVSAGLVMLFGLKIPALFAPSFRISLISVSDLTKRGLALTFEDEFCFVSKDEEVLGVGERSKDCDLYMWMDGKCPATSKIGDSFGLACSVEKLKRSLQKKAVSPETASRIDEAEDEEIVSCGEPGMAEQFTLEFMADEKMCFSSVVAERAISKGDISSDLLQLHRRFGHCNMRTLLKLLTSQGISVPASFSKGDPALFCVPCSMSKQTKRTGLRIKVPRTLRLFYMIHCDICGPFNVKGLFGECYYSLIVEDSSRIGSVLPMKDKKTVYSHLDNVIGYAQNLGFPVVVIRSDNGREYLAYQRRLPDGAHTWEFSPAYTQHANGVAERRFRLLNTMAICLLIDAFLPDMFWPFAIAHANDVHAVIPQVNLEGKSPFEIRFSTKPSTSHMKVFGCIAFRHLDKAQRAAGKWVIHATPCMHLGNARGSRTIYRLWDFVKEKIYEVSSVTFREDLQAWPNFGKPSVRANINLFEGYYEVTLDDERLIGLHMTEGMPIIPVHMQKGVQTPVFVKNHQLVEGESGITYERFPRTYEHSSGRPIGPHRVGKAVHNTPPLEKEGHGAGSDPAACGDHPFGADVLKLVKEQFSVKRSIEKQVKEGVDSEHLHVAMTMLAIDSATDLRAYGLTACDEVSLAHSSGTAVADAAIPSTFRQAKLGPEFEHWKLAMRREMEAMFGNKTFKLESAPRGAKPLYSKWVFSKKPLADGDTLYKARWVAGGNDQILGVNYEETYAPTVNHTTLRTVLALSSIHGWEIRQMDVVTAFLNPEVDNDNIYVRSPQGIEEIWPEITDFPSSVRLSKALYGLKQSPRLWWLHIDKVIRGLGMMRCDNDTNCFWCEGVLLLLYVDDILVVSCDKNSRANEIAVKLMATYKMKDLGPLKTFLGFEVLRNSAGLYIHQKKYIENIVRMHGLEAGKLAFTPADTRVNLLNGEVNDNLLSEKRVKLFRSLVGSLLYASLGTRPDIAYATAAVSRFAATPTESHLTAALRIVRYLKNTINVGLFYNKNALPEVSGFVDSDWASNADRRSIGGYCFLVGESPVSWKSKRQPIIAMSTLEAELIAASEGTREAIWLGRLVHELSPLFRSPGYVKNPVIMRCDNMGAIALITRGDMNVSARTKHIEIRQFHARDTQTQGLVQFEYVQTEENTADIFTKALNSIKFDVFCKKLALTFLPGSYSGADQLGRSTVETALWTSTKRSVPRRIRIRNSSNNPILTKLFEDYLGDISDEDEMCGNYDERGIGPGEIVHSNELLNRN